ncbi:MAG: hypothetical protein ACRDGT_04965 [Candidatus Limnocylindria bacterium]
MSVAGIVFTLTMATAYVVIAREHIAALDVSAYPDPTLNVSISSTSASSGSVMHVGGAPAGAFAEFSGDGVRAYGQTFALDGGVALIVPPIFRADGVGGGELDLRLLVRKGPIWTSSSKTHFTVETLGPSEDPPGTATLFALHVTHALVTNAADAASTAAEFGAPEAVAQKEAALTDLRSEIEELAKQFELAALGNRGRIQVGKATIDADGIRSIDRVMRANFTSLDSACAATKGARTDTGLGSRSVDDAKAAAALYAHSLLDCDPQQLRELSQRTGAWLSTLGYTAAEVLDASPQLRLPALLSVVIAAWSDEAVSATYIWEQYGRGEELRIYLEERATMPMLPEAIREAARDAEYLYGQSEQPSQRSFEAELLAAIATQDQAEQAAVAAALEARSPLLTTPTPRPVPPVPVIQGVLRTPLPSVVSRPGDLSYAIVAPPRWTVGTPVSFSFCVPKPASSTAPCGPDSLNPTGGTPPYTFTYTPPPGLSMPFYVVFHSNGIVSGTPRSAMLYTFDVCVKDGAGGSACQRINGVIDPAPTSTPSRP